MNTPETDTREADLLREPAQILSLLNRLKRHRSLLSAQCVDAPGPHSTLVLGVDATQRLLHLDMLHPEPQQPFSTDGLIWLRGRMLGGLLRFRCRLNGFAIHDEGPVLRAALPEWIELREQRRSRRLPIPDHLTMSRTHLRSEHGAHEARLIDISAQGAAALADRSVPLPPGTQIDCHIELPGVHLLTRAEVRTHQPARAQQRLGLRFVPLGSGQEDRLMAALNRLERQLIRSGRAAA